jgi:hypothetical protein
MSRHTWKGRIHSLGKLYDMTLVIVCKPELAGPPIARRLAKSRRKTAVICYGAIRAELTEMQEVIP